MTANAIDQQPNPRTSRLVWIDMEMTGLDPDRDCILELATIITDADLEVVAEGPVLVIHRDESVLGAMDEWNTTHHTASGLVSRVRQSTVDEATAEAETLAFIEQYVDKDSSPLCGNSIWQDRRFIAKTMRRLDSYLHYRNIDVSTVKELARRWYPNLAPYPKTKAHTALQDIKESIGELVYLRTHVFR